MPIYEYQCPKCQHIFEEWVHSADAHGEEPCPQCGTPSPRIISHTSFVLKGGGWYVSDYGYRKGIKEDGTVSMATEPKSKKAESSAAAPASQAAASDSASAGSSTAAASSASSATSAPTAS